MERMFNFEHLVIERNSNNIFNLVEHNITQGGCKAGKREMIISPDGFIVNDYHQYRKDKGKAKGPNCPQCKYFKICEGPWKEYPEIYSWDEFKPIKN